MQRYHSSDVKTFRLLDAPELIQTATPVAAGSSSSSTPVNFTAAAVPEVAACYATPSEGVAEYPDLSREIVMRMTAAARAARNTR
jgi:hypothetical protein